MKNLLGFNFNHLRGDFFGGITAGIVALPLALAFGLQSGMGAAAGLYGAIFLSFFAALFGGTNTQISGPTAPMTAVSLVIVADLLAGFEGDMSAAVSSILVVFVLAGLIQILLGILKVGQYIRYIPYPVVSGFMTGIGVIIIITQILPLIGYYPKEDIAFVDSFRPRAEEAILERILKEEAAEEILVLEDFKVTIDRAAAITQEDIDREATVLASNHASGVLGSIGLFKRALQNINFTDLVLGLLTIFIVFGFKRITKKIPSTLVALVLVSSGAYFFLPEYRTIGEIPSGFPSFRIGIITDFNLTQIQPFIFAAISLALLGAIDSLLTSVVADNKTKTKHKPNKELLGQGIGNTVSAFFGGIPGAGATIRTLVNIDAGGKTKLSGMIAGLLVLIILLSLGPVASQVPAAVLAGILITVGIGVMDYKGLAHIRYLPVGEIAIMFLVLGLTVFVGLIEAVVIGLILASILFMKKVSDLVDHRTKSAPLKEFPREVPWEDEKEIIEKFGDKVYIKHLDGPLFFGFASRFQDMVNALPEIEVVVIRMDKVPYVDQSGLYAIEDAVLELQSKGIRVVFTDLHGQPLDMFERFNIIGGLVDKSNFFDRSQDCMLWIEQKLNNKETKLNLS